MKKIFLVISIFMAFIGISILIYNCYLDSKYQNTDQVLLQEFFEDFDNSKEEILHVEEVQEEQSVPSTASYLAVIEIPKISLYTGIVILRMEILYYLLIMETAEFLILKIYIN